MWGLISFVILATSVFNYGYAFGSASRYIPDNKITSQFSIPQGLEKAVDFWIDVYSKYDNSHVIIHDSETYTIYEVVNVSDIEGITYLTDAIKDELVGSRIISVQKKHGDALRYLASCNDTCSDLEPLQKELYEKFQEVKDKDKFLEASRPGRMRAQKGQSLSFKRGLYYSGKYLPDMEKIFTNNNLPVELTRLPFVESYFDPTVVSHKEASGIWQFMPGTGKEYLNIREGYDERNDPVVSTHAAAKLLKQSYSFLWEEWPLAVTAYNHGRFGMKRAADVVGTKDLVKIIKEYKNGNFGFASKNFYAEFLAALFVEKNKKRFFNDINLAETLDYGTVVIIKPLRISQLELLLDVDKEELKHYNPALSKQIFMGQASVPEGVKLKVPMSRFKRLLSRTEVVKGITNYVKII